MSNEINKINNAINKSNNAKTKIKSKEINLIKLNNSLSYTLKTTGSTKKTGKYSSIGPAPASQQEKQKTALFGFSILDKIKSFIPFSSSSESNSPNMESNGPNIDEGKGK